MANERDNYFSNYYEKNKERLKASSNARYHKNKDKIKRTTAEYRKSDDYKKSKALSNKKIQDDRRLSSLKSELQGVLGRAYSLEEDLDIVKGKELYNFTYKQIAELLSRSMKGVEYRYNLLRKKREQGDDTIPTYLK